MTGRVCIIGAGPSGMSALGWFAQKAKAGQPVPEVVCYEKQLDWGGLWNFTWRTGTDEFGEPVHCGMYKSMWSNLPKECIEFPNYTYEEHFGKPIPSYLPREALRDYLVGKWSRNDVRKHIKFNRVVRDVAYKKGLDKFDVTMKDLVNDVLVEESFDFVIVATGHYSVPNVPSFDGIDKFPGRIMHAHDLKDAKEFESQRVLVIGALFSGLDVALQCAKFGAKHVTITWRTNPLGFKWPKEIEERPLLQKFEGKKALFADGSSAEVDAVIMCTGYLHSHPFLRDDLRLKTKNVAYPPNLYKGVLWTKGGNNKLFYVGVQNQCYSFTMFEVCSLWAVKVILGELPLPTMDLMLKNIGEWEDKASVIKILPDLVPFQTEHLLELVKICGDDYPYNLDCRDLYDDLIKSQQEDIVRYRDIGYTSKFTGKRAPVHHTPWMDAMDTSLDAILKN